MTRRVQQTAWLVLGIGLAVCASRAFSHRHAIVTTRAQAREVAATADAVRHDVLTLRNVMQEATVVGRAADWTTTVERPLATVKQRLEAWREAEPHAAAKVQVEGALVELGALQENAVQAHDFLGNGQRALASEVVLADGAQLSNALYTRLTEAQRLSVDAMERTTDQLARSEASLLVGLVALGVVGFISLGPVVFRKSETADDDASRREGSSAAPAFDHGHDRLDVALSGPVTLSDDAPAGEIRNEAGTATDEWSSTRAVAQTQTESDATLHSTSTSMPANGEAAGAPQQAPLPDVASLCTEFARVKDRQELEGLLDRAMTLLDARGLIVWHAVDDRVLKPVLARGYGAKGLARMPELSLAEGGSITGAYRAGDMRVIAGRNGDFGALVLPLHSAEGCLGVVTVELRAGESTVHTQAVGRILVAQLATIVAPEPVAAAPGAESAVAASHSAG